jgi:hypothetical protein
MRIKSVALVAIGSSTVAFGQTAAPVGSIAPAPSVAPLQGTAIAPASMSVLRVGTVVPLKTSEQLTTKDKMARVGERFRLEVAENVMVDGQTVIPVGSPAMGEVTEVRNKGMWGKSGHLTAQVLYVQVNGRQIRLRGTFDDKGVTGTAGVVAAIAFVPIAGFITTGTSANIPVGSGIKAFVDEDVPVQLAATAPAQAPLVAVAPAAPIAAIPTSAASPRVQPVAAAPGAAGAPAPQAPAVPAIHGT